MASKWKYADLDAEHRLRLLQNGNEELFREEVERTKEITKARRELGLDTVAQEKWMDTVGYNYNLSQASLSDNVSRNGYAELYLNDKKADTEPSAVEAYRHGAPVKVTKISGAKNKIKKAAELARISLESQYAQLKMDAEKELYEKYPYLEEQLVNSGASLNGGKTARAYLALQDELEDIYAELDNELYGKLSGLDEKYAGLTEKLVDYKNKGASGDSLMAIADMLVKKAAREDGFDASLVPGVRLKNTVKVSSYGDDESTKAETTGTTDTSEAADERNAAQTVQAADKNNSRVNSEKDGDSADSAVSEADREDTAVMYEYIARLLEAAKKAVK